jgi:hypothetical protein
MNVKLTAEGQRIVAKRIRKGECKKPEDVVNAALAAMDLAPQFDFAPRELDALIAEGEESLKKHGSIDGRAYFAERRRRRGKAARKAS